MRILLKEDRVGPFRDRCAGEDAHGLALADRPCVSLAGGRGADHREPRGEGGHILRAHRVAIHGRGVERRLGPQRRKRPGENAPVSLRDRHAFGFERPGAGKEPSQRLFDGQQVAPVHAPSAL